MPPPWKRPKSMDANRVWNCYQHVHHDGAHFKWWYSIESGDWFYERTGSQMPPPTKGNLGGGESSDDMTVTTNSTRDDDAESTLYSETTTTPT
eukprot:4033774-Karenia_brevis.AAC.1